MAEGNPRPTHGDVLRAPGDAELVSKAKQGDTLALAWLWERTVPALRRAWHAAGETGEPDLESIGASLAQKLTDGGGPSGHDLRLFLYTQLRAQRGPVREEADEPAPRPGGQLAERLFVKLPGSAREGLWFGDIERLTEDSAAQHLGIDSDELGARYEQGRRALVTGWLKTRLAAEKNLSRCRAQVALLVREATEGALPEPDRLTLATHLSECERCAAIHADIEVFRAGYPRFLVAMALGPGVADSWFAEDEAPATTVEPIAAADEAPASADDRAADTGVQPAPERADEPADRAAVAEGAGPDTAEPQRSGSSRSMWRALDELRSRRLEIGPTFGRRSSSLEDAPQVQHSWPPLTAGTPQAPEDPSADTETVEAPDHTPRPRRGAEPARGRAHPGRVAGAHHGRGPGGGRRRARRPRTRLVRAARRGRHGRAPGRHRRAHRPGGRWARHRSARLGTGHRPAGRRGAPG
ncbi:hypothetical protein [Cellulomonas denverensis]|uniref:hypothetical protein n=1 Tax=Cellulomonas denverensis TaxID=264297 RepID=UPI0035E6F645